jgi:hypothetical protein
MEERGRHGESEVFVASVKVVRERNQQAWVSAGSDFGRELPGSRPR